MIYYVLTKLDFTDEYYLLIRLVVVKSMKMLCI